MTSTTKQETSIGVLLVDVESGDQLGVIRFTPQGVLIYQLITDKLHPYAFRNSVEGAVKRWIGEPLYNKYKHILEETKKIPEHILEQEADECIKFLNAYKRQLNMGRYIVKAVKIPVEPGTPGKNISSSSLKNHAS